MSQDEVSEQPRELTSLSVLADRPLETWNDIWRSSAQPRTGTLIRAGVASLLVVAAIVLFTPGLEYAALIASAVAVFLLTPLAVRVYLGRLEREVLAATRSQTDELITALRERKLIKYFAPHAWLPLQEARLHLRRGDGRAAERAFAETARLTTDGVKRPELLSARAQAMLLAGDHKNAHELLKTLAGLQQLRPIDHLALAIAILHARGKTSEAIEHLEHAREAFGGHPRVLAGLALAHQRKGDGDQANELLERAKQNATAEDGHDPVVDELLKRTRKELRSFVGAQSKRKRKQANRKQDAKQNRATPDPRDDHESPRVAKKSSETPTEQPIEPIERPIEDTTQASQSEDRATQNKQRATEKRHENKHKDKNKANKPRGRKARKQQRRAARKRAKAEERARKRAQEQSAADAAAADLAGSEPPTTGADGQRPTESSVPPSKSAESDNRSAQVARQVDDSKPAAQRIETQATSKPAALVATSAPVDNANEPTPDEDGSSKQRETKPTTSGLAASIKLNTQPTRPREDLKNLVNPSSRVTSPPPTSALPPLPPLAPRTTAPKTPRPQKSSPRAGPPQPPSLKSLFGAIKSPASTQPVQTRQTTARSASGPLPVARRPSNTGPVDRPTSASQRPSDGPDSRTAKQATSGPTSARQDAPRSGQTTTGRETKRSAIPTNSSRASHQRTHVVQPPAVAPVTAPPSINPPRAVPAPAGTGAISREQTETATPKPRSAAPTKLSPPTIPTTAPVPPPAVPPPVSVEPNPTGIRPPAVVSPPSVFASPPELDSRPVSKPVSKPFPEVSPPSLVVPPLNSPGQPSPLEIPGFQVPTVEPPEPPALGNTQPTTPPQEQDAEFAFLNDDGWDEALAGLDDDPFPPSLS